MDQIGVSTEVLFVAKRRIDQRRRYKSDYDVDIWHEVKKRWLVLGVLFAVMAAVVAPALGDHGGYLHPEYTSYIPLSWIYYRSGTRGVHVPRARVVLCALLHAHLVAPAVAVVVCAGFHGLDARIVKGALISSVGGPCGWLALSVSRSPQAPLLVASSYLAALLAEPLAMMLLCGRATVPPLGGIISTLLTTLPPFLLGTFMQKTRSNVLQKSSIDTTLNCDISCSSFETTKLRDPTSKLNWNCRKSGELTTNCDWREVTTKCCMLLLLYCECCVRVRDAAGVLCVGDVFATLALVVCVVTGSALCCSALARGAGGRWGTLVACALPKCYDAGWISSASCTPSGLSRLPAVFFPAAQALLLAAINTDDHDCDRSRDHNRGDHDDDDDTVMVLQNLPQ